MLGSPSDGCDALTCLPVLPVLVKHPLVYASLCRAMLCYRRRWIEVCGTDGRLYLFAVVVAPVAAVAAASCSCRLFIPVAVSDLYILNPAFYFGLGVTSSEYT